MIIILILVALTSAFGAWIGSKLYERKNRNPVSGAIWGGLAGLSVFTLIPFIVIMLFVRKLKPHEKGYYSTAPSFDSASAIAKAVGKEGGQSISSEKVRVAASRLREIHSMYEQKIITEEDYLELKSKVIGEI